MNIIKFIKKMKPGIKLYSPVCGECEYNCIDRDHEFPINVLTEKEGIFWFSAEGQYDSLRGECLLFPSKDERDWNNIDIEAINKKFLKEQKEKNIIKEKEKKVKTERKKRVNKKEEKEESVTKIRVVKRRKK